MEFLDARRLTGPNVLGAESGAVLDIACNAEEADTLIPFCEGQIRQMLDAVGWSSEQVTHVRLHGGISIMFSAPIDALYAASAINEWVWACCDAEFNGALPVDFANSVNEIRAAIDAEVNPSLLALEKSADEHGKAFLWDDDEVSIGHGARSQVWPFRELPHPHDLQWQDYDNIPVGIVTGTNGKTTSVRIAKHILQTAGRNVGVSCTDWVAVNDNIVDRDDWSGPGGARMVLRQDCVDVAILETARGGLLRRGLGVTQADAALITNIAEDHLGDFGSQSLQELLNIKWVVSHAVRDNGVLILNADDELLVAKSKDYSGKLTWFSLDERNPLLDEGVAFYFAGGNLVRREAGQCVVISSARDIPITMDGAAMHNVANCLGAAALTENLGMSLDQIRNGLQSMSQEANPGRSNVYSVQGFKVLVDFAHNPEAMQALFAMARAIPAKRRVLCFGQAGDRTDTQIRELAASAWAIGLDQVMVAELENYLRGREVGAVYDIICDELRKRGARDDQIAYFPNESESFDAALAWAEQGDLVVLLDLGRDSDVEAKVGALL